MIVSCEHHSGMGLCSACSRAQDEEQQRERSAERDVLRRGAHTLAAAARILEKAGRYHLAQQVRAEIPR